MLVPLAVPVVLDALAGILAVADVHARPLGGQLLGLRCRVDDDGLDLIPARRHQRLAHRLPGPSRVEVDQLGMGARRELRLELGQRIVQVEEHNRAGRAHGEARFAHAAGAVQHHALPGPATDRLERDRRCGPDRVALQCSHFGRRWGWWLRSVGTRAAHRLPAAPARGPFRWIRSCECLQYEGLMPWPWRQSRGTGNDVFVFTVPLLPPARGVRWTASRNHQAGKPDRP